MNIILEIVSLFLRRRGNLVVYKDVSGDFRWKYVTKNGYCLCIGSEGYKNRADMLAAILSLRIGLLSVPKRDIGESVVNGD